MSAPVLEHTDYPSLRCGHPEVSCTDVHIVGLHIQVYGLAEVKSSDLPLACVNAWLINQIATHGRCNKKEQMAHFAHGLIGAANQAGQGKKRSRDVIVATMDQRNHGSRLKDRRANLAYDQNERHLYDMAACITGGCQDVSLVMDFIAAYLFPYGEKRIEEFVATGISLGGNVTWRLLREEPRIRIAIPIIGLPFSAFGTYLRARAHKMGLAWAPPLIPPSIQPLVTIPVSPERYVGKKILSIHGAADELVPIREGQADLHEIQQAVGKGMEVWSVDGVGHRVTQEMVHRTGEWVWQWAMSSEASS